MTTDGSPLDRLRALEVPDGAIGLSWLGQAGFILRAGGATALIDPFLAPYHGREYESGLTPGAAGDIDLVLCTHEHVDHFDAASAPAIATASPGALFVVPTPIVDMVTEAGIAADRVVGLQPGETLDLAGLTIGAVPALHVDADRREVPRDVGVVHVGARHAVPHVGEHLGDAAHAHATDADEVDLGVLFAKHSEALLDQRPPARACSA